MSATLTAGETAKDVKERLYGFAVAAVKEKFGESVNQTEMDLPF